MSQEERNHTSQDAEKRREINKRIPTSVRLDPLYVYRGARALEAFGFSLSGVSRSELVYLIVKHYARVMAENGFVDSQELMKDWKEAMLELEGRYSVSFRSNDRQKALVDETEQEEMKRKRQEKALGMSFDTEQEEAAFQRSEGFAFFKDKLFPNMKREGAIDESTELMEAYKVFQRAQGEDGDSIQAVIDAFPPEKSEERE